MSSAFDRALARALDALSPPGVLVGHRLILPGDERALFAEEAVPIASAPIERRRASGAARIVGRELAARLGIEACAFPRGALGAPIWPDGITGSFAHDDEVAVAAIGRRGDVAALGIDVEPAEALPSEMVALVATPRERPRIDDDPIGGRLLFAAKEAVYKAVHPLDGTFLDYHDIEVDLADGRAVVRNGRVVDLRYGVASHLVVLAFVRASSAIRKDAA